MSFSTIISIITSLAGGALSAGWPGVVALVLLAILVPTGLVFSWKVIVGNLNSRIDGQDTQNAGADAGNTAIDLANQGREVSIGLDAKAKADPPTDGFPKEAK
jgi:hypothetical protein